MCNWFSILRIFKTDYAKLKTIFNHLQMKSVLNILNIENRLHMLLNPIFRFNYGKNFETSKI